MKCPQCATILQANARFCPKCGKLIDEQAIPNLPTRALPGEPSEQQPVKEISELPTRTVERGQLQQGSPIAAVNTGQTSGTPKVVLSQSTPSEPLLQYRTNTTKGLKMATDVDASAKKTRARRRSGGGCALGCLTTLVILLIILAAGWLFALRPYVHNIAYSKLDSALTQAVNNIPSEQIKKLPSNSTIPVQDNTLNNLFVLNIAPADPVQKPETTIDNQRVRIAFELYGYPCAISFTPTVEKGRLVTNNTSVEGVFGLIMSPEELKTLLDKHFSNAQDKIQRTVTRVEMKNHVIGITLG